MDPARVLETLRGVLPASAHLELVETEKGDLWVRIGQHVVRVRPLREGWLRQVREALSIEPLPDLLVARVTSSGARAAASNAGVGWVDETGAASFTIGSVVVSRTGVPRDSATRSWRPAAFVVAEALLTGTRATVADVVERTGLAAQTAQSILAFLEQQRLLVSDTARGRRSARRLPDDGTRLLDAYAQAVAVEPVRQQVRVAVSWADPVRDLREVGELWTRHGISWAATGALGAAMLAPFMTEIAPLQIYVDARSPAGLRAVAEAADLTLRDRGALYLRPFPSDAEKRLVESVVDDLRLAPWPRIYADLRPTGVRGEEAAEHLREAMQRAGERGAYPHESKSRGV